MFSARFSWTTLVWMVVAAAGATAPAATPTNTGSNPSVPARVSAHPAQDAMPQFTAAPTPQPQTIAEVKPVQGVPTLVIDGKPYGPMAYTRCDGTWEQLAEIADHRFAVHFEMVGSIGLPGRQQDVFRRLDAQLHRMLQSVPNAKVVLRLYLCNPPHFARDYPNEVLRFNDGSTRHFTEWYAMKNRPMEDRGYPSFASRVWRRQTCNALCELAIAPLVGPAATTIGADRVRDTRREPPANGQAVPGDDGKTWESLGMVACRQVNSITIDRRDPHVLYLGMGGNGVFVGRRSAK